METNTGTGVEEPRKILDALLAGLPPALKREQVVLLFGRCGLGGQGYYKELKAAGTLIPLRGLPGAKQARYAKDHVRMLCETAMLPKS